MASSLDLFSRVPDGLRKVVDIVYIFEPVGEGILHELVRPSLHVPVMY